MEFLPVAEAAALARFLGWASVTCASDGQALVVTDYDKRPAVSRLSRALWDAQRERNTP